MKVSFRAIWETWATPPNISCLWNGKVRFWSVYVFFYKNIWVKNKGTILFTNHFYLGWKENSLKIDWNPVGFPEKLLWFQRNRARPKTIMEFTIRKFCDAVTKGSPLRMRLWCRDSVGWRRGGKICFFEGFVENGGLDKVCSKK